MFLEIKGKPLVPLDLGQLYLLGKQTIGDEKKSNNFIEIGDGEYVSPRHCVIITNQNEEVFVFDLFSSKGTILNNTILKSMEKTRLKCGDVLKIGEIEIEYQYQGRDVSHDSSGFLETHKNTSDIVSSPESNHEKLLVGHNFLVPAQPSPSFSSSRRSDSFTIPETQHCESKNSTNVSIAESVPENGGKIKFNFGKQDSFEDDDLCIPETQELIAAEGISPKQMGLLNEECSVLRKKSFREDGLFRICTQDYNDGFGEEENADCLTSQIIPIVKHSAVELNISGERSSTDSQTINRPCLDPEEKEMSSLKWTNSKTDHETTELRADCITPDLFDLEDIVKKMNQNVDEQCASNFDEDEEDFLPTQCPPSIHFKIGEKTSLQDLAENPCLPKENEEVLILSDKENRCPERLKPLTDMLQTQPFEANASKVHTSITTHSNSISSAIKLYKQQDIKSSSQCPSNVEHDAEDDLLTQAFRPPTTISDASPVITLSNTLLSSTLLDSKCTEKPPVTLFKEMEKNKTPFKQKDFCSTNVFKKPDKDISVLKKTSSASSSTSENYVDLLMCTPQLIKDNWSMEQSEDLKKQILAVKNRNLFGDETEDDDDDQSGLVKLINVPKDSLDFDQLLPHLNKKPEKERDQNEADKIYKFNICFGKEQDKEQTNSSSSKASTLSRDERHAARDKEREISARKLRAKPNKHKEITKVQETKQGEEKTVKNEDDKKQQDFQRLNEEKEKKHLEQKNLNEEKNNARKLKEKARTKEIKTKESKDNEKTEEVSKKTVQVKFLDDKGGEDSMPESSTRLRKKQISDKNKVGTSKSESKPTPAKRLTRSRSRLEDISPFSTNCNEDEIDNDSVNTQPAPKASRSRSKSKQSNSIDISTTANLNTNGKEEDNDSISTQPVVKVTRSRSKTKQHDSADSIPSTTSTKTTKFGKSKTEDSHKALNFIKDTKNTERKRKGEAPIVVTPAKIERKILRSVHSQESLASPLPSVSISTSNVDYELMKDLVKNSKGLWNIAKNPADCDILVMDKPLRTFKFLLAMARGIPIVTTEYLKKLNENKSPKEVRLIDYHFSDNDFENKYKFSLLKSLQAAKKQKIFKDYEFVMTANIMPIPEDIKAIIEVSGGKVHNKTPPPPKENQKLFLVTAKEDKKDWHKFRRLNKNIIIVSTEAIMSTIMSQSNERMNCFTLA